MAVTARPTDYFPDDLLNGVHQPGDVYKMALYRVALAPTTMMYDPTQEIPTQGAYHAGGMTLHGRTTKHRTLTWANPVWPTTTITARGALIYNASKGNRALAVVNFGQDFTSMQGDFVVQLPAALIRL